ncbi:ZZ-type zinc finger-containing protein 3-like [Coregonus clupeaformis]|uniref:ZZ-type zinc finger-containing protein 3-like n=1 Tax=Coregonus clupeaformis TaxID=59861 RepID=UPI001E1C8D85|nr:ZZ-type zinc finger-containing protein 3-like [Coregonus clupeaformis]
MATSRSSRVTRSSVGLNGLDENFCGRTLRNRSIAQPEEGQGSPLAGSRAPRSPKKRQDGQTGASEKPGAHQGKVAHHKATSVDGETWASPRKRVLSCSEREGVGGSEKAENCEGRRKETPGAAGRDASPILKRAKRCSRSGESHGSKDDPPSAPPKPDSPASPCAPSATIKENSEGGDLLRQNSTAASPCAPSATIKENSEGGDLLRQNSTAASPCAPSETVKEEGEEEEDDVGGHIESDSHAQQPQNSNSHKSRTGLGQTSSSPDAQTNSLGPSAATSTTCPGPGPALLNGSQRGVPPDPIVPSRNSDPGQEEEGKDSGEYPAPLLASFEEDSSTPHLSVREEEVDVVGDSVCREEEVTATEEVVVTATEEEEVTATGEEEVAATEEEVVVAEEVVVTATEEVVVTATEEEEVTATEEVVVTATEEVVVTATEEVVVATATEEVVVAAATEEETATEEVAVTEEEVVAATEEQESCGGGINGWSFMPLVVQDAHLAPLLHRAPRTQGQRPSVGGVGGGERAGRYSGYS